MLSTTAEYALRAVVWLAAQDGASHTTEQISHATEVPAPYLSKVLQTLGKAGIVRSQRGQGGGFFLEPSPEELTVLAVVNAVDPLRRITTCPLKLRSHGQTLCPLHRRLDEAAEMIENVFRSCTISDLFDVPGSQTPLCAGLSSDDGGDES